MLALAGDNARARFVIADSPKMLPVWRVPMASRQLPLTWMALTTSTSLGGQRGNGAPRIVLTVVVTLVLKGWQGV